MKPNMYTRGEQRRSRYSSRASYTAPVGSAGDMVRSKIRPTDGCYTLTDSHVTVVGAAGAGAGEKCHKQ
ncbi:unnamed protein product [Sphenostylis stenocarpa]|uniref:Uncharacterized protein n=1 Tax=Sphenostylis stenocarpa TaxID=92480 RepID=A0AA86VTY3_9FABA|nr:unnamed protein product [Sphenostylis stenocarpa]